MNAKGVNSNTYILLKALPVMPEMASAKDITKIVPQLKNVVSNTIAGLPSTIPICQEGNEISFVSEEAKQETLRYYRSHDRWPCSDDIQ